MLEVHLQVPTNVTMPLNTIQLFVVNNVMESVINQFIGENHSSGNRSFGAGGNLNFNLLPMTLNHVPSYNGPVEGVILRIKIRLLFMPVQHLMLMNLYMIRKN